MHSSFQNLIKQICFFYDPHSRSAKGLPLPLGSQAHGTAVMVTFTHLNDMIDRLLKYHRVIGTQSSCYDEWKPVEFLSVNMANLNDATPDSESQSTNLTTAVPTALQDEAPRNDFSLSAPEINTLVADLSDDTVWEAFKAVMLRQIISYVSTLKKAEKAELEAVT